MKEKTEKTAIAGEEKNDSAENAANEVLQKIEAQQKRVERLNKLFLDRERFRETHENLLRLVGETDQAIKSSEFETPNLRFVLVEGENYNLKEVFKISHPEILKDVIQLIDAKISSKIQQLNSAIVMTA